MITKIFAPLLFIATLVFSDLLAARPSADEAVFAGGCFWCMQPAFDSLEGVLKTTVGYTGGNMASPSYEQVSAGHTGHTEAILVSYDPGQVSYNQLLATFWKNVDPVDGGGQFCDRGTQYRSGVFYSNDEQKRLAIASKDSLEQSGLLPGPIQTEITLASPFYAAENYHQNYYRKNPQRYKFYSWNCGRKQRLDQVWSKVGALPFITD